MKRIASVFSAILLCALLLTGCSNSAAKTDWDYIQSKGEMIIGYTIFEPMNYLDESNNLVGFDTELAQAVCDILGVTPKFIEINWETKEVELNAKNLDCIWNGFTVDADRKEQVDFSLSYVVNKQVVVVKAENAEKYATINDMAGASVSAEKKSAGENAILSDPVLSANSYTPAEKQTDVLLEIKSGTTELGVIDQIMAIATIGEGTDYADLTIIEGVELAPEEYAIGFRKDSPETLEKINGALQTLAENGKLEEIAAKYNLSDKLAEGLLK